MVAKSQKFAVERLRGVHRPGGHRHAWEKSPKRLRREEVVGLVTDEEHASESGRSGNGGYAEGDRDVSGRGERKNGGLLAAKAEGEMCGGDKSESAASQERAR